MIGTLISHAAMSSYLAGAAWILGFITLFIFFAVGGVFGPINDAINAISVFQFLSMVPAALALHRVLARHAPLLILGATIVSIVVMVVIAVLQVLLVFGLVRFEQTLRPILALSAALGLWWLVTSIVALALGGALPAGLAWVGILAGISAVVGAIGFWIGGQKHPLAAASFVALAVSAPIWCFWLGKVLAARHGA